MTSSEPNHYATLGLDRNCSAADIRNAYRALAKRYHPDVNHDSAEARIRTQELNAAHEVLSDAARRRAYDRELDESSRSAGKQRGGRIERNITQDVALRIEDFLRGTNVKVQVKDAGNVDGPETYQLHVPPGTAPGTRFRVARSGAMQGGHVILRLKVLPGYRFKARGSDLRCELRIDNRRATHGGSEAMEGPSGGMLRVQVPAGVKRGEIVRVPGEGLPKPRGGRGDLLVRITYRPEVAVSRLR